MKAVILAGGRGSRIMEESNVLPKPMINIGSKPMLWHIMQIYSHYNIKEFVVCLGYRGYAIREYFKNYYIHNSDFTIDLSTGELTVHKPQSEDWKITLVDTGEDSLTAERIKRIREFVDGETFCMTYGDGVSDVDIGRLIAFHKSVNKTATVTAVQSPSRFGLFNIADNLAVNFDEKPTISSSRINGGFFVLEPSVFDHIPDENASWEDAPMRSLSQSGELAAYEHDGFWHPMDTLRDKLYLESLLESEKAPWLR